MKVDDSVYFRIVALREIGWTLQRIARHLKVARRTISLNLAKGPPSGRSRRERQVCPRVRARRRMVHRILSRRVVLTEDLHPTLNLDGSVRKNSKKPRVRCVQPEGSLQKCRRVLASKKVHVSKTSVWRDRIACGLQCRRRPKGPERVEGDTARRLSFAKNNISFAKAHFQDVVFVDEKMFDSSDSDVYCYVNADEQPIPRTVNRFPPRVHVFGMIGTNCKELHMFEPNQGVTGDDYIKLCLAPHLRRLKRSWLLQDNAGPHTATEVRDWLTRNNIKVLEFPARSPDMNVIEKCWSVVQQKVSAHGPLDAVKLRQFVREEWNKIPMTVINNLCAGWPGALERVVKAKGETATK